LRFFKSQQDWQRKAEGWVHRECRRVGQGLRVESCEIIPKSEEISISLTKFSKFSQTLLKQSRSIIITDSLQIFHISSSDTDFHLVIPWSGKLILPHEFFSIIPGRLPGSIAMVRKMLHTEWIGVDGGGQDTLAQAANAYGRALKKGVTWGWFGGDRPGVWNWNNRRGQLSLKWGIQAIPLNKERFLHIMQTGYQFFSPVIFLVLRNI